MNKSLKLHSSLIWSLLFAWTIWLLFFNNVARKENTISGSQWSIQPLDVVAMRILLKSKHYGIGSEAWNSLLPSGGHTVHTVQPGGTIAQHTVTMFHQLRCLQIIQDEYVADRGENVSYLTNHCLNYLRQIALCHMDTRLEAESGSGRLEGIETFCRDWTVLFNEAEKNYASISQSPSLTI